MLKDYNSMYVGTKGGWFIFEHVRELRCGASLFDLYYFVAVFFEYLRMRNFSVFSKCLHCF